MEIPTPFPEHEAYVKVSQVEAPPPARDSTGPKIRSAADLRTRTFEPINFIVPGYVAEGCTILAGRPKLGKSWLMLDIGLTVASGGRCLGVQCAQRDVLYIALEDNERRLQSRITKLKGATRDEWPARFHYATEWPQADSGGLKHIRSWLEGAAQPGLVVIDVLAAFRSRRLDGHNQYEADYQAVQGLQRLASEFRTGIVVVHHVRKSAAEVDPFEKVSGTFGLSGAADTVMILDRDSSGTTIYGRGRDIQEIETAIAFDAEKCRWNALGPAPEFRRSDERGEILAVMTKAGVAMMPKDIATATGMSGDAVRQLLRKMVADGEVSKATRGHYLTTDHSGHKVTNDDDQDSTDD